MVPRTVIYSRPWKSFTRLMLGGVRRMIRNRKAKLFLQKG